jgi:hypothetical protein
MEAELYIPDGDGLNWGRPRKLKRSDTVSTAHSDNQEQIGRGSRLHKFM